MLLYKQDDPQVITNPAIITGWGEVFQESISYRLHTCVYILVCLHVHMCKIYYQFLTRSQRSLHAWLTSIVPIMSGILIRPCLIIVNIAFYDHLIIIIIITSDQIDIVLGEW